MSAQRRSAENLSIWLLPAFPCQTSAHTAASASDCCLIKQIQGRWEIRSSEFPLIISSRTLRIQVKIISVQIWDCFWISFRTLSSLAPACKLSTMHPWSRSVKYVQPCFPELSKSKNKTGHALSCIQPAAGAPLHAGLHQLTCKQAEAAAWRRHRRTVPATFTVALDKDKPINVKLVKPPPPLMRLAVMIIRFYMMLLNKTFMVSLRSHDQKCAAKHAGSWLT